MNRLLKKKKLWLPFLTVSSAEKNNLKISEGKLTRKSLKLQKNKMIRQLRGLNNSSQTSRPNSLSSSLRRKDSKRKEDKLQSRKVNPLPNELSMFLKFKIL
jgi:hypothetical protein